MQDLSEMFALNLCAIQNFIVGALAIEVLMNATAHSSVYFDQVSRAEPPTAQIGQQYAGLYPHTSQPATVSPAESRAQDR